MASQKMKKTQFSIAKKVEIFNKEQRGDFCHMNEFASSALH